MTEIREPNYTIDLPGEWEQGSTLEEGATVYRDTQGTDTVTVLLLGVKQMFSFADPMRILSDYLHHRPQFEAGHSGKVQSTEPWGEQDGDSVEGGWDAVDVETGRRMRHRVVLAGSLLADFRFVAFGLDEEDFGKRADEILSTVTVTPPE